MTVVEGPLDPATRERVATDLRGVLAGDVLFDPLARHLRATDASLFQIEPLGVVCPRDENDVVALVKYAAENGLPLAARGGGTGFAGESLTPGLAVDFARHMHGIADPTADAVVVQPGAVLEVVNRRLAPLGRRFAPDPLSAAACTVGGMVATDASGPRAVRHGTTAHHLRGLRAVLEPGVAVPLGVEPVRGDEAWPERLTELHRGLAGVLAQHADAIAGERSGVLFDRCGYRLRGVLSGEGIDYPRLLAGSEGTLALVTEVTLRTVPLPGGVGAALFAFADMPSALRAVPRLVGLEPSACELLDRRLVSLVRREEPGFAAIIPAEAGAALLVEFEADRPSAARRLVAEAVDAMTHHGQPVLASASAHGPAETEALWRFVRGAWPALHRLAGRPPALAFVDDVAVPPAALPEFIDRALALMQRFETTAAVMVHALAGQVELRPFLDPSVPADAEKLWPLAEAVATLAWEVGGSIGSRLGVGLARTPWVARQRPTLAGALRDVKELFDPHDLLNPGKVVGPDPSRPAWPLRTDPAPPTANPKAVPLLLWQPGELAAVAAGCSGCGDCRTQEPARRMCPLFRVTHEEEAAPRAKANLLARLLQPDTDPAAWTAEEVRDVADLCVNCKMCRRECPSGVDIPKWMLEAKARHAADHGLSRADWVLARIEQFSALGSHFAFLSNALAANRAARWVLEKVFGISRTRRLPRFAHRTFLQQAHRAGWTKKPTGPGERAALFVDVYANYHDPAIAEAAVRVLQHAGVQVHVPRGQTGCGMAPLAVGDAETAREAAVRNLRTFAELARDGYRIVCPEPTAAVALTQDYLALVDDPDAALVASRTVELTTYLRELKDADRLPTAMNAVPLALGHHVPCHVKALGGTPAGPDLLAMIPGARVRTIDVGCSGMAGPFGLRADRYADSLAAGAALFAELRRPGVLLGSTECSSCRLQMQEGAGKRTLHPVQYLALAYGLMPELARRIARPLA